MKLRAFILFLLITVPMALRAQDRYFYYLRFDPAEGNASAIVDEIDRVVNSRHDTIVVFLSQASAPVVANAETWPEVRQQLLTQQAGYDYYSDVDERKLDSLFAELFDERVSEGYGGLELSGRKDSDWRISFILSDQMWEYQSVYENIPQMCVSVNQLQRRMSVGYYAYGDEGQLREVGSLKHDLFNF